MGHPRADPEPSVEIRKWKNLVQPKEELSGKIIKVLECGTF